MRMVWLFCWHLKLRNKNVGKLQMRNCPRKAALPYILRHERVRLQAVKHVPASNHELGQ